jgi:hypothetical protein
VALAGGGGLPVRALALRFRVRHSMAHGDLKRTWAGLIRSLFSPEGQDYNESFLYKVFKKAKFKKNPHYCSFKKNSTPSSYLNCVSLPFSKIVFVFVSCSSGSCIVR